jgi:outer membrane protein OmpA-like peptidoglycan-associated protein
MRGASYGKARGTSPAARRVSARVGSGVSAAVAAGMGLAASLVALAGFAMPGTARADEPWLLGAEASALVPLGEPEATLFGPGGSLAVSAYHPLTPWLLGGARLRLGLLSDGEPPARANQRDPGLGGLGALTAALRFRPSGFGADDGSRGAGFYAEVALGAALTGTRVRFAAEAGVGYLFRIGPIDLGPTLRFTQIVEPQGALDDRDGLLLCAGVEALLFDPRPRVVRRVVARRGPGDTDHDTIVDPEDACVEEPEDADGFEDADGCPDLDNDADRVRDADDGCPLVAEDRDGFEDADGCPEPDNDGDGILDVDDRCPFDAEIVNGVDDADGCPDEGLIALVDDRIVLDETVLFDVERARVKSSARPVLNAIVTLISQHPEWTRLRIEGHADTRGDATFNQDLSERRAANVRDALVGLGVSAQIIESVGYGATRPRAVPEGEALATEALHQRNRRVEFVVVARRGETPPPAEEPPAPAPEASPPVTAQPASPGGTP